jgi:2-deoxy-D-gluconate 3-dehydrogenase
MTIISQGAIIMNNMFDLTGKLALVTGGNKGIGKGIAEGLASAGADIIILARTVTENDLEDIKKYGVRAYGINFDLREFNQYDDLLHQLTNDYGDIDILVNNAGLTIRHPSIDFPKEDWDKVIDINMTASFYLCQKVGKLMIENGGGKIINIASLLSYIGGYTVPAYAASKGGVSQYSKSLANEWAKSNVNVNCIAPGYIETNLTEAILEDKHRSHDILNRIPAGRWGKPEDLSGIAVFLSSSASDYINGCTIPVDGGFLGW